MLLIFLKYKYIIDRLNMIIKFSYRLCSLSIPLSIRLLNRFNSSSDSRKPPFVLSFAVVGVERFSLDVDGWWGTLGFVGVTGIIVVVLCFLFDSIENEADEHESVRSLK